MDEIVKYRFRSLAPRNMEEAIRFAEIVSRSDLVPKEYRDRPANVLVAVQWGAEIGLAPLQSLQSIAVINGRPSLFGDAALAVVRAHAEFEAISEEVQGGVATCTVRRKGAPEVVRTFSEADAKKAGLWQKQGPWTQYPQRMLQMRARAWALRDVFPDVLKGIGIKEEVDIPVEVTRVEQGREPAQPPRLAQPDFPLPKLAPPPALPAPEPPPAEEAPRPKKTWAQRFEEVKTADELATLIGKVREYNKQRQLEGKPKIDIGDEGMAAFQAAQARVSEK